MGWFRVGVGAAGMNITFLEMVVSTLGCRDMHRKCRVALPLRLMLRGLVWTMAFGGFGRGLGGAQNLVRFDRVTLALIANIVWMVRMLMMRIAMMTVNLMVTWRIMFTGVGQGMSPNGAIVSDIRLWLVSFD